MTRVVCLKDKMGKARKLKFEWHAEAKKWYEQSPGGEDLARAPIKGPVCSDTWNREPHLMVYLGPSGQGSAFGEPGAKELISIYPK